MYKLHMARLNFPSITFVLQAYFAVQWPLDDFGVFLCGTVAMTQLPIFSISPAEHLKEIHLTILSKKNIKTVTSLQLEETDLTALGHNFNLFKKNKN